MLRISIYHWLPLADNMLPDIEKALCSDKKISDVISDGDYIDYSFELDTELDRVGKIQLKGKINSRGFNQSIINIPPPKDMALAPVIEMILPTLQTKVANLLFEIAPYAVRNKTGILEEKIVSFQQFESRQFEAYLDNISRKFLMSYRAIAILVDKDYEQDIRAGFYIESKDLSLKISATNSPNSAACDEVNSIFFFFSNEYAEQEIQYFENVVYKYCAAITYLHFIERAITILKDVRDHVIPLRRQLAIALQRNTEEHFVWLTRMKKYLTYVNIKLPVIERVKNHLEAAYTLGVRYKLELFERPSSIEPFSTLTNIQLIAEKNKPLQLEGHIKEALGRLDKLYDEAKQENSILSNELSQVLIGSLESENVQITARDLDATRSLLELDRGGKNRANALKVLSVVLSGTLGLAIADVMINLAESLLPKFEIGFFHQILDFIVSSAIPFKLFFLVAAPVVAYLFTEWSIAQKSNLFRLVIPFSANLPPENIHMYLEKKKPYTRFESSGQRRVVSWDQKFIPEVQIKMRDRKSIFNVIIDYEKRGYVYSVSLEAEHSRLTFDILGLVIQVLSDMDKDNCLKDYQQNETSLLAEVLIHLGIHLEEKLIALNKVLALPAEELSRDIEAYIRDPKDPSMSDEDRKIMKDIESQHKDYIQWFIKADKGEHKDILLSLLGSNNIKQKLSLLRKIEFEL